MAKLFFLISIVSHFFYGGDALKDLQFLYNTLKENHPGMYNTDDPSFVPTLEVEYIKAQQALKKSVLKNSQEAILKQFIASFNDSHLRLVYYDEIERYLKWAKKK